MVEPRLLVVEDDPTARRTLVRLLAGRGEIHEAASAEEARDCFRSGPFDVAMVDAGLPEGPVAGLALLQELKGASPGTALALVSGNLAPEIINAALLLGARMIAKPAGREELEALFALTLSHARVLAFAPGLQAIAELARDRYGLTAGQAAIVAWVANGNSVSDYAAVAGISESTRKRHVRDLLARADAPSVAALVLRLMQQKE